MCREIVENVLSGTKAGFKATRNLVFNQKVERSTMNRQKSREIVENVLSGTKAGFKAILNFEHAIERKKMNNQKSKSNFSAILLSLTLMVAALGVSPAVGAEKEMVTDPSTGKMVTAPEYGGTLTVVHPNLVENTDPFYSGHTIRHFIGPVNEKLGISDWALDRDISDYKSVVPDASALRGNLAESWETPDATTIIFHIRRGVRWHDKPPMSGRELTADDVVYSLQRAAGFGEFETSDWKYTMASLPVESITATDKHTVVFKLERPSLDALTSSLSDLNAWILPPEVIEKHGDYKDWRNMVGTGPFMLTDWSEGVSITHTKIPDYWGHDEKYPENRLPYVDELKSLFIKEKATRLAALRSGKIDLLCGFAWIQSVDVVKSLQKTNPELQIHPVPLFSNNSINLNRRNPPFDDIGVRQAMQMALDLETINETYYSGWAMWKPQGLVGVAVKGYYVPFDEWPEEVKKTYTYDPKGAEALLDAAGYPRGADGVRFKTTLQFRDLYDLGYVEIAEGYWDAIGVDVEINAVDTPTWVAGRGDHTYEMSSGQLGSAPKYAFSYYRHTSVFQREQAGGLPEPELDAAYEGYYAAATIEQRQRFSKLYDMFLIRNQFQVWGPLQTAFQAANPWVKGWNGEWHLTEEYTQVLTRLWIDQDLK